MNYNKKRDGHIALSILGAVLVVVQACSPSNKSVPTDVKVSPAIVEVTPNIGVASIRSDRDLEVIDAREFGVLPSGNQFIEPISSNGGKLVVVSFEVTNTGNKSGNLTFSTFTLTDTLGREYTEVGFEDLFTFNYWAESQGYAALTAQLFPGQSVTAAKLFRVAPDATVDTLVVNDVRYKL